MGKLIGAISPNLEEILPEYLGSLLPPLRSMVTLDPLVNNVNNDHYSTKNTDR